MPILGIMASQISGHLSDPNAYIAFSMLSTNSVQVYIWNNGTGFGSKFADPSGTQSRTSVGISPNKKVIAAGGATPSIQAYLWSQSGFGTIYSAPATAYTTQAYGLNWTSTGNDIGMAIDGSPYGVIYAWSSGFGSKYADPATLPQSSGRMISFTPSNNAVAVSGDGASPWVSAYPFTSGTGWGTKYANPSPGLSEGGRGNEWNPAGNVIALSEGANSPYISAYAWSSGFSTKYANPATSPGQGQNLAWSPDGTVLLCGKNTSPYIQAYAWSSGFGTKYANPATLPAENAISVAWNNLGTDVFSANYNVSPYVAAYAWSSGFGSKYSNPATAVSNTTYDVSFAA